MTDWRARVDRSLKYYLVGSWIFAGVMLVLWLWLRFHPPTAIASLSTLVALLPIVGPTVVVYVYIRKARFWINVVCVGVVGLLVGALLGAFCGFLVELYWVIAGDHDKSTTEAAVQLLPAAGAASGGPIAAAAWLVRWQQREKESK